jgi:Na+/proline symporter
MVDERVERVYDDVLCQYLCGLGRNCLQAWSGGHRDQSLLRHCSYRLWLHGGWKWKRMGIGTPAEYIEKRFGNSALHFYTWFMMAFRIVGTGGALYAIARLTLAVIGGSGSANDAALSSSGLNIAILVFALIVVGYTMVGGLWAVLMTDTLQFIILNLAVLFVVPLSLARSGVVFRVHRECAARLLRDHE